MNVQDIKQRFGIIGNSPLLNRAVDIASQVASTDLSVLITGESGTGKEVFPKIIHQLSSKKHGAYIAVNCGAIPEGTIDSELFGHEKGSFTGAYEARKGYFEVANGGTIFLDEIAELPLSTQVRLLRVLESGEFIRVGSSKAQKTNVRLITASNVNIADAISNGRFREDLYYRLNTVPIWMPPLRERKEDILLLFNKFASDFAENYRMPPLQLEEEAQKLLVSYRWPGNIRQLKNITEQISIIEKVRQIDDKTLLKYLPQSHDNDLPVLFHGSTPKSEFLERELLYKVLFDMKKDVNDLKKIVLEIIKNGGTGADLQKENIVENLYNDIDDITPGKEHKVKIEKHSDISASSEPINESEVIEESLSLEQKEIDLILKALKKHRNRRKNAAKDLGISERTLYRKIKEYDIK